MSTLGNASKDDLVAEVQRASTAEASLVSGTSGLPSGGSNGVALWSDANGQPQYTDAKNGTRALALQAESTSSGASVSGGLINKQIFNKAGQYTYTPTSGTKKIIVKLIGAGGGGGGINFTGSGGVATIAYSDGVAGSASGGNAGEYAESNMVSVPASPVAVTVGAGGTGGKGANAANSPNYDGGTDGGLSSFGSVITCPGGMGGPQSQKEGFLSVGVNPGVHSAQGQPTKGATGNIFLSVAGEGSGNAGYIASDGILQISSGGGTLFGPGGRGYIVCKGDQAPTLGTGNGEVGTGAGSGGSGAWCYYSITNSNVYDGGNGADGLVIVEEYA